MFKILLFVAFLVACYGQEINPKLVVPGYSCSRDYPCNLDNCHCNPMNECQCDFPFHPDGGKEYKDCNLLQCYDDDTCSLYYGPNVRCNPTSNTCVCQPGWHLDPTTQTCTFKGWTS